ncbi:MAG: UDP-N-acetylmuramoyl-L-alanyl-D-glutamate--2,6-diaminopimelate ligase [Bacilli bacterium]|nr:UDP-N-acetylmuramoyl-L-alanyl-D-glutamate--2,6-diaminopimelate ligase [Bacilli bacterium]
MKKLSELYPNTNSDVEIKGISINSKEIKEGDIFVCTMGVTRDRHDFIPEAIENGAVAVVVSKDVKDVGVPIIKVEDTNKELPYLCQRFYDYPDEKLKMIGVTGTDGKTSTTTIIQTLIGKDLCGYIGTNGRSYGNFTGDNPNTTPDAQNLYMYLNEFVEHGCKYASIETSSEAFFRGRLQAMSFDVAAYTNVTSEHLNIHGSFENYLESKLKLFKQTKKDGFCIINNDDPYCEEFKKASNGKVLTYGKRKDSDLQIVEFKVYPSHTDITYKYKEKEIKINSPLMGDFNVYNLACALLCVEALGYSIESVINRLNDVKISGRLELLKTNTPYYVMVDYAHTPNGISKLLNFVHTLDINRSIVVIGQAGERDPYKRPKVGNVVVENASYAIFCYEDPRSEDPMAICEDIIKELKETHNNYEIVIDRREAINKAISMAKEKDMVLILGKGNETYEKLKDGTIYFNDIEEAYNAVNTRKERESINN